MAPKKLGIEPLIHESARVVQSQLGRYTEIGERTTFTESVLGDYSYIVNDGNVIYSDIGKFCSIAAMVRINPGNHPMGRASQAHFTYRSSAYFDGEDDETSFFDWRRAQRVTLGHDVWVGHGAIILPGCSIGTGAVIAGGAVVRHDVEPYTIVAGVPAKPIKRRFSNAVAERLLQLAWWEWSHDRLQRALPDFRTLAIEDFLDVYEAKSKI